MNHDCDILPRTLGTGELVRRIVWSLNAALAFAGHSILSGEEHFVMFDLGEASAVLDRLATLPRMAVAEERARRDLLEVFDIFTPDDDDHLGSIDVTSLDDKGMMIGAKTWHQWDPLSSLFEVPESILTRALDLGSQPQPTKAPVIAYISGRGRVHATAFGDFLGLGRQS